MARDFLISNQTVTAYLADFFLVFSSFFSLRTLRQLATSDEWVASLVHLENEAPALPPETVERCVCVEQMGKALRAGGRRNVNSPALHAPPRDRCANIWEITRAALNRLARLFGLVLGSRWTDIFMKGHRRAYKGDLSMITRWL